MPHKRRHNRRKSRRHRGGNVAKLTRKIVPKMRVGIETLGKKSRHVFGSLLGKLGRR